MQHTTKIITFRKINEPYGWLGNMSAHAIEENNILYPTAEHYFQCLRFEDKDLVKQICSIRSPMGAKMKVKTLKDYFKVFPRTSKDVDNMSKTLDKKIEQHPSLKLYLEDMKEALIIEDVSNRPNTSGKFWGMALVSNEWIGENHLGNLWMQKINNL
jgi:predicted NAD-dependent protein-ADP-ribosyltransferase YbiA (DUF1768 family)